LALLVTGNLEITNAQLACGGLAVGGSVSGSPLLSQTNAQNLEGSQALAAANSLDFASLRQRLLADSDELCSLSSTGQLSLNEFGGAVLDASLSSSNVTDSGASSDNSSNVAIFNLPSSALANLTSLLINGTSANGFVIINIIDESGSAASSGSDTGTSGTTSSSNNNLTLSEFSTDAGNLNGTQLLWNFCNASRIDISNILLQGTILAPRASVSVNRAELEGALIAQSLIGNFFNHIPLRYQGVFCPAGSQSASASPSASPAAQVSASPSA
jgi:choice-of-anchor A domain-containing protein